MGPNDMLFHTISIEKWFKTKAALEISAMICMKLDMFLQATDTAKHLGTNIAFERKVTARMRCRIGYKLLN